MKRSYNNVCTGQTGWQRMMTRVFLAAAMVLVLLFAGRMTAWAEEVTAAEDEETVGVVAPHYDVNKDGGTFDGTKYVLPDGTIVKNAFLAAGEYTYFLQNNGTPMTDRLTYHPDGEHIIYFDAQGHEVFSNFTNVKASIAGDAVDDLCFFDVYGYMYVDVITYDQAGVNLYYANPYGVMERNGWFQFSPAQGSGYGYAQADGTLLANTYTYDWNGNYVFIEGNGMLQGSKQAVVGGDVVSKKGMQGTDGVVANTDINIKQSLFNIHMNDWISDVPTSCSYVYNGKTFYFKEGQNAIDEHYVKQANKMGVKITFQLIMAWDEAHSFMIYPGAREAGHSFYALNTNDDYVNAMVGYLAKRYGQSDCHVDNWIIGNEVNMPSAYNYTGTLDVNTNVSICADSFLMLYNALQRENPNAKAYICLDHSWSHNDEGRGIAGKEFLNNFWAQINQKQAGAQWNIAYHLYTPIMQSSRFWDTQYTRYTPNDENADFVSAYNLNVLTDYVKNHFGESTRIILSEQGFDTREGEQYQAAALAYTFYAAQYNDMIDAAIFRAYKTDPNDTGFDFGLIDASGRQREAYNVFKYMDSANGESVTNQYLSVIGADSWSSIIPNYRSGVNWK